ncbi:MAG TPA: hypothetical protein VJ914_11655 [Pseudonocardiaceae bacterium]|nr:hypothetical protein [Pseudonocardiaceae bacterium]
MPLRLGAAVHVFVSVLILGTMWRMIAIHAIASSNPTVSHLGAAMRIQY